MSERDYDLQRFRKAQEHTYQSALSEILNGRKQGHWIWFIFPQLRGLGLSETSQHYGISGLKETIAYQEDPLLGSRLVQITTALLGVENRSAMQIFGHPDNLKVRSSMTLFGEVPNAPSLFRDVLKKYFHGEKDGRTVELLHNAQL